MSDERVPVRVVTISASYGAGGSIVGPQVAEHLGLPFLDRAIPHRVAERLSVPVEDAISRDERVQSRFWAGLAMAGGVGLPGEMTGPLLIAEPDARFQVQTEHVIRVAADTTGGVILGRAAAVVLGPRPDTLRVRLDGPKDRRLAQAVSVGDIDEATASQRQRDLDRAWNAYVRRFYRADPTNPHYYDIVFDATAIELATCVELIVAAARAGVRR
jgi:cytidylate kinase